MGLFDRGVDVLPNPTETIAGTQIPSWVSTAGQELYGEARELVKSPYPAYTGQRIATYDGSKLTPEEQEAARILGDAASSYQPYIDAAYDATTNLSTSQPYLDIAQAAADPDSGGTVSGRLSMNNPNLQQLPARNKEFGGLIRGLFLPEEGEKFTALDYSQQ